MRKSFLQLMMMLLPMAASAYDFEVNGIYYNFNTADQTATVTYDGEGDNGDKSDPNRYTGRVVIPSSVTYNGRTLKVARLSRDAFYNCKSLTEVVMPNTIKEIGNDCFYNCTSLVKADLPESIETVREGAFSYTKISSVVLPESLSYLGQQAFSCCELLETVTVKCAPSHRVYSNLHGVFYKSENIKEVIFESGIKKISNDSFWCFGDNVRTVVCMSPTPPTFSNGTAFSNKVYVESQLFVPVGCKEAYATANVWNNFFMIEEKDFSSGIAQVSAKTVLIRFVGSSLLITGADANTTVKIFDAAGKLVSTTIVHSGENIVPTSMQKGEMVILRIGTKSYKFIIK